MLPAWGCVDGRLKQAAVVRAVPRLTVRRRSGLNRRQITGFERIAESVGAATGSQFDVFCM